MTARQRVACAFDLQPYDKVPIYQAGFSAAVGSQILGREAYVGGGRVQYLEAVALWNGEEAHQEYLRRCHEDAVELCRTLKLDIVRTTYWRMPEKPTRRVDEFTFVYGDENATWRVMRHDPESELYQIIDRSPVPELTMEDLQTSTEAFEKRVETYEPSPAMFDAIKQTMDQFGDDGVPYGGGGVGLCIPRDRIWLEAIALRPDIVGRYLAAQAEQSARNAALAGREGIRYLYGGGDFASAKGPFYSPKAFHELMLPGLRKITAACEAAGTLHGFASDGDLWSVADDLFGNVHFFYELDCKAGMGVRRVREAFPEVCLLGGVNSETLHRGSVDDVKRETEEAVEAAWELGGCVIGCSNQIVAGTPMENVWAMMEILWQGG